MGCDIHGTVEKKIGSKWIMVNRLHYKQECMRRDYHRFAALAGVRGDGPHPKGLPVDMSESTRLFVEEYGSDGHSQSYMDLVEAANLFLKLDNLIDDYSHKYPVSHYFDMDMEEICEECGQSKQGEYRFIFFFDN